MAKLTKAQKTNAINDLTPEELISLAKAKLSKDQLSGLGRGNQLKITNGGDTIQIHIPVEDINGTELSKSGKQQKLYNSGFRRTNYEHNGRTLNASIQLYCGVET